MGPRGSDGVNSWRIGKSNPASRCAAGVSFVLLGWDPRRHESGGAGDKGGLVVLLLAAGFEACGRALTSSRKE